MGSWRNRPKNITHIPEGVEWIVGIDESGSASLKYVEKYVRGEISPDELDQNNVHFNVTACILSKEKFYDIENAVMNLKYTFWERGYFSYKGEMKRVCFHSTEIRRRREAFEFNNQSDYEKFINSLDDVLKKIEIKLFSCHIDKVELVKRYKIPYDPYELSLTFLLERIAMSSDGRNTILILESRGKKEDRALLKKIVELLDMGTKYHKKKDFSFIKGVYFNSKWDVESRNLKSYWILELADLYCFPIFKYGRSGVKDRAFHSFKNRIDSYPNYKGKGIKKFP